MLWCAAVRARVLAGSRGAALLELELWESALVANRPGAGCRRSPRDAYSIPFCGRAPTRTGKPAPCSVETTWGFSLNPHHTFYHNPASPY